MLSKYIYRHFWTTELLNLAGWKLRWEGLLFSRHRWTLPHLHPLFKDVWGKSLSFTFVISSNLTVQCKTPLCLFPSLLFKLTSCSNICNREEGVIWSPPTHLLYLIVLKLLTWHGARGEGQTIFSYLPWMLVSISLHSTVPLWLLPVADIYH